MKTLRRRSLVRAAATLPLAGAPAYAQPSPAEPRAITNVIDFGAKGDHATDDTEAIQRAIDSVDPIRGGTVFLPPGGYRLSRPIILRAPSTRILGAGRDETVLLVQDHTFDIFVLRGADSSSAPWLNGITIEDLWINCFGHSGDQAWVVRDDAREPANLAKVQGTPSLFLRRLHLSGMHSGVLSMGGRFRADDLDLVNLREGKGVGIEIGGSGEVRDILNVWMGNAIGQNAAAGIIIRGGAATTILNCELMQMGIPLWVRCGTGEVAYSVQLISSWCDTSSGAGMTLQTSGSGKITRVSADTCWFGSCRHGIAIDGNVWGLMVANSQIADNAEDGVFIAPGSILRGASFNQVVVAQNRRTGFHAGAGVGDFSLSNSILGQWADFRPNGEWGCLVDDDHAAGNKGAADGYIITGNRIRGNGASGQLHDGGTGRNKIVRDNIIMATAP